MSTTQTRALDIDKIRADFPILTREAHPGQPLVYLDSAATSQKPAAVIETLDHYYRHTNANVHRGIHVLAEEATADYENARKKVAAFINAPSTREVIFVRNTTEGLNLVAQSWGRANIQPGDTIILTEIEHHSNLVPWQMLAAEKQATIQIIPVTDDGQLDLSTLDDLLAQSPKVIALTHMSNVLGTINPVKQIVARAHAAGAIVVIDGAQSAPHLPVDVQDLDADFFTFSGHKMCGPTGIGVLYGKRALLEAMPPWMGGGDMIKRVTLHDFVPNDLPYKFEAGTPNIAQAIGLGAAIDYLQSIGMDAIHAHEQTLAEYLLDRLVEIPGLQVYGPEAAHKGAVAAFTLPEAHAHDVAQVLDSHGVAVRAGHHCAMPLHQRYGLAATARASLYLYNTTNDVDKLVESLYKVKQLFA